MITSAAREAIFEQSNEPAVDGRSLWDFVEDSQLQSLVLGPSKDPNAKVTILLVSPVSKRTVLAVKAPTTDRSATAVETERKVLSELAKLPARHVLETIPRPVDAVEFDGRQAVVMTAVPGTPMMMSYLRRRHRRSATNVAADFAAADGWLDSFRRATAGEPSPLAMGEGVRERLRLRFAGDERLDADLDRLAEIYSRLREEAVPRTAVHGDFWFGNILVANGRVSGVVDWEAGSRWGEPTRDLARFALIYALYLGGAASPRRRVAGHPGIHVGTWGAAVEYAFDGNGWFPELFRRFLGDGLARLGASPAAWRELALAGIAEITAFTDHDDFARLHLDLFRRVAHASRGRKEIK
jgi:hypothetical protein